MLKDFAISIIRTLRERGHKAYLVGGCVRDLLLGREPADYDVTTDALPKRSCGFFLRLMPLARSLEWCWFLRRKKTNTRSLDYVRTSRSEAGLRSG